MSINIKFINHLIAYIKLRKGQIISIHQIILSLTEEDIKSKWKDTNRNPYSCLLDWLLEYIIVIGTLTTSVSMIVFNQSYGWKLLLMPIGYGCLLWLFLEIVRKIRQVLNE